MLVQVLLILIKIEAVHLQERAIKPLYHLRMDGKVWYLFLLSVGGGTLPGIESFGSLFLDLCGVRGDYRSEQ